MKNYHVVLVTLIAGVMLGCAVPAHAADYSHLWSDSSTLSSATGAIDSIGLTAADYTDSELMFKNMYPVRFWITALLGGLSAVFGFFALIYGLFLFTRKPSIRSFFGGAFSVVSYLFFTGFWAVLIFDGVCDGHHSDYIPENSHFPDLTALYWYWGLSALSCVVWGFWRFLTETYKHE